MHLQQKYQITNKKFELLPTLVQNLQGSFVRSTLVRDLIFSPDNRAYHGQFTERFGLSPSEKGLFLRLREENDLTSGKGNQSLSLQAYKLDQRVLVDDQVRISLDATQHRLSDVLRFLELIGLDKVVEVTKKRTEYTMGAQQYHLLVCLDQVESLASAYVEIHASGDRSELPEILLAIESLRSKLQLSPQSIITLAYYQLLLQSPSPKT